MLEILSNQEIDFILTTVDVNTFVGYISELVNLGYEMVKNIGLSKVIGYTSEGHIAYKKQIGVNQGIFESYELSEQDGYLYFAIFIMSIIIVLKTRRITWILNYNFELNSILLKQNLTKTFKSKETCIRIMLGCWMYAAIIIGISFANRYF